jgi:hypothetical protein
LQACSCQFWLACVLDVVQTPACTAQAA